MEFVADSDWPLFLLGADKSVDCSVIQMFWKAETNQVFRLNRKRWWLPVQA